jgi:mannose-6-phosphate isomerase-like protein (cupin superfamily)
MIMSEAEFFELSDVQQRRAPTGKAYLEFLRVNAMSAGVYVLPSGGMDLQTPHKEDELYYVVRGRARMRAGDEDKVVSAGSVIYVAAGVEHRFHNIEEELTVLVFFAPAEN